MPRAFDENLNLRLRIDLSDPSKWPRPAFEVLGANLGFPNENTIPKGLDLCIAQYGGVQFRFAWEGCPWSPEVETSCLNLCEWVGGRLLPFC